MIKALRAIMIVWAAQGIILGLGFIFFPGQIADLFNMQRATGNDLYGQTVLGITWVIVPIFIIFAARNPLKNIMWTRVTLALAVFYFLTDIYSFSRGYLTSGQATPDLIIDGIFAVLLLVFYPWRTARAVSATKEPAA